MINITKLEAQYLLDTVNETLGQLNELDEQNVEIDGGVFDYLLNAKEMLTASIKHAEIDIDIPEDLLDEQCSTNIAQEISDV